MRLRCSIYHLGCFRSYLRNDAGSLLRALRKERVLIRSLIELGLTRRKAIEVLTHDVHSSLEQGDGDAIIENKKSRARKKKMEKGNVQKQTEIEKLNAAKEDRGGSKTGRWNAKHSRLLAQDGRSVHDVEIESSRSHTDASTTEEQSIFDILVPNEVTEGLVDASDREEGEGVVVWWNDLETDER